MKKYIVLSVNENPKYLFYLPLVVWAWRRIDWEPIIFFQGERTYDKPIELLALNHMCGNKNIFKLNSVDGYKSETITQVSRLFGACVVPEGSSYLMTSDVDMLPLSDYWKPNLEVVTVYGRDLTDYHYPMCYVGMPDYRWEEIMDISSRDYNAQIKRSIRQQKNIWTLDQDLITEKINSSGITPVRVDRGTDKRTGYPVGRVDRSNWTLNHRQFIDCHAPHDILTNEASFKKVMELLHTVWPKEDWKWFISYYKEFKKLL